MWIIITGCFTDKNEIMYLGWQNPAWDDDGYFWTSKETIQTILWNGNNTKEHPFLFNTREDAIIHLKRINIPQKCRVIKWQ